MKILQRHIQQADFVRTVLAATPEPGTKLDDMLQPDYWAHIAKTLKPGYLIEVRSPDGEWYAELYVRSANDNSAHVVPLRVHSFAEAAPKGATQPDVDVKFRGDKKWSVVRKSDKAVLVEGLDTKGSAEDWVKANQLG